jgi:polysaccharide biosynthesis protein PslG
VGKVSAVLRSAWGCALAAAVVAAQAGDFLVGAQTHFALGWGDPQTTIEQMRGAGMVSLREEAPWAQIEQRKGVLEFPSTLDSVERAVDQAVANGMQPLLTLDFGNKFYDDGGYPVSDAAQAAFVRYAEFVVEHFKGRVRHYEVYNEWNRDGDAKDYARLLKKVYAAIKRIDPTLLVLGGAVEGAGHYGWIETLMQQGAAGYMDGLSLHPYAFWKGREVGTPEYIIDWLEGLQAQVLRGANGGRPLPIYITEVGWANNLDSYAVSEKTAADYLARLLLLLRSLPYVRGVWWYAFHNYGEDPKDREHNFGLVSAQNIPKASYAAMQQVAPLVAEYDFVERVAVRPDLRMLRFRKRDDSEVVALWHTKGQETRRFDLRTASGHAVSARRAAAGDGAVRLRQAHGADHTELWVNETPLLISTPGAFTNPKAIGAP